MVFLPPHEKRVWVSVSSASGEDLGILSVSGSVDFQYVYNKANLKVQSPIHAEI